MRVKPTCSHAPVSSRTHTTRAHYCRYTESSPRRTANSRARYRNHLYKTDLCMCIHANTHKDTDMHGHTQIRDKNRCLQTYAYMLCTHTHENAELPANTDVSRQTWMFSYIWRRTSSFNSWRHLYQRSKCTVCPTDYRLLLMHKWISPLMEGGEEKQARRFYDQVKRDQISI